MAERTARVKSDIMQENIRITTEMVVAQVKKISDWKAQVLMVSRDSG